MALKTVDVAEALLLISDGFGLDPLDGATPRRWDRRSRRRRPHDDVQPEARGRTDQYHRGRRQEPVRAPAGSIRTPARSRAPRARGARRLVHDVGHRHRSTRPRRVGDVRLLPARRRVDGARSRRHSSDAAGDRRAVGCHGARAPDNVDRSSCRSANGTRSCECRADQPLDAFGGAARGTAVALRGPDRSKVQVLVHADIDVAHAGLRVVTVLT